MAAYSYLVYNTVGTNRGKRLNDKYYDYFNDEGEFRIPFEQIQRGKHPRRVRQMRFMLFSAAAIGTLCGLGWLVMVFIR
jgi:hypothetical protein